MRYPASARTSSSDPKLTYPRARDLNVTEDDLIDAQEYADGLTLADTRLLMKKVLKIHEHDPNFPLSIIERIKQFLGELRICVTSRPCISY
jgi:hypothetical protein